MTEFRYCPECGAEVIVDHDSLEGQEYCCDCCPFCGEKEDFLGEG